MKLAASFSPRLVPWVALAACAPSPPVTASPPSSSPARGADVEAMPSDTTPSDTTPSDTTPSDTMPPEAPIVREDEPPPPPWTCRRPWDCEPDADLVGTSVAALKVRLGEPDWTAAQELVYRFPSSCSDPPQRLVLAITDQRITRASFAWSLGNDCLEEALSLAGASQPLELGCPPRAASCPAVRRLVGLDEIRVIEGLGLPHHAEAGVWTYFRPRGCAYERNVIELRVAAGRVTAATWKHEWTGQHCEIDG